MKLFKVNYYATGSIANRTYLTVGENTKQVEIRERKKLNEDGTLDRLYIYEVEYVDGHLIIVLQEGLNEITK